MGAYFWLTFSLFVGLLAGIFQNIFAKKHMVTIGDCFAFTLMRTVFSSLLLVVFALCTGVLRIPSVYSIVCGILYGFLTSSSLVANTMALSVGSYATTSLLCSTQMLIPAFSGYFFWNEDIHNGQYIGIALLFCGLFLCLWQGKQQKFSFKWLIFCLCTILSTGLIGIVQKVHQNSEFKQELTGFLIVSFLVSIVYLAIATLLTQRSPKTRTTGKMTIRLSVIAAFIGLCTASNHLINTDLVGKMDSVTIFPIFNGSSMFLTLLISIILFRERFNFRQICGFLIGLASIVMIGIC